MKSRKLMWAGAAGFLIILTLFGLLSCSPGGYSPSPAGPSPELKDFIQRCQQNVDDWQHGQAIYPKTLIVKMDESIDYVAGVDISGGTTLRDRLPANVDYSSSEVDVSCGLGARLVSTSESAVVDQSDWIMQEFDQPGKLQWAWTVKGKKPGDYDLRLELRPAVAIVRGGHVVPAGDGNNTAVFPTKLTVTATSMQKLYLWWDANWVKLVGIVTALGAALLGVLAWVRKVRDRAGGQQPPSGDTSSPSGAAPPSATGSVQASSSGGTVAQSPSDPQSRPPDNER
jgi:hypothetical protein